MTTIRRFEHEILRVGPLPEGGEFTPLQWDALVRWQEKQGTPYFTVLHRGVKMTQWVGVLQVGSLTLEILPKAEKDRTVSDQGRADLVLKWKAILFRMLRSSRHLDLRQSDESSLNLQRHTLLDLVFDRFLQHAEALVALGLMKKYRQSTRNRKTMKGRLDIGRNERTNLVHRERFYTTATEFDGDNVWNRILWEATRITSVQARLAHQRSRAQSLLLGLPDWGVQQLPDDVFSRLQYDRRSEAYRSLNGYAELILSRQSPDLQSGRASVFAILFDMNKLWEAWVLSLVKKHFALQPGARVTGQSVKAFWSMDGRHRKTVRPDIVVEFANPSETLILDTKWKVLETPEPSDDDLKQMYVYERLWGTKASWFIYPEVFLSGAHRGEYTDPGYRLGLGFLGFEEDKADRLWSKIV